MNIPATILVIEDDPAMIAGLRDNLEVEGYRLLTAGNVHQGRETALRGKPDLILLDVMLSDGDGVSLCRELRAHGLQQPIIMLTARGEEGDKVRGFEGGADDYIVKPFGLRELLARIHAQLRRHGRAGYLKGPVAVGMAVVDFKRHQLSRDGELMEVSAKELELLRYVVLHRGEVVSRDSLLTEVWGHQREVATRTVDNFIVRLRKKIEADPADPRYLITVHGSGYKLVEQ
jgi:DNA-binding response OmpR family regulator